MIVDGAGPEPIDLAMARTARAAVAPSPMAVEMAGNAAQLLGSLYRTEDVAVAPDGRRVAIPSFFGDHAVLADLDVDRDGDVPTLHVSSASIVQCEQLRHPHGAAFLDDRTLLVANRGAELMAIDVPPRGAGPSTVFRTGRVLVGEHDPAPVAGPSSLSVRRSDGLADVLVCNNHSHTVTRYLFDIVDDLRVIDREVLIGDGLATPDGVDVSASGRWIAVSNHDTHEVFVYAYEPEAESPVRKVGTLRGANFPHGVRFVDDDRAILLGDAGLPYLYVFRAGDADWTGVRDPARTLRVMDDDTFNSARYNPQEGGPKGLAVLGDQGAVVLSSAYQHLACLSLDDVLAGTAGPAASAAPAASLLDDPTMPDLVRRSLRRRHDAEAELEALRAELDDARSREHERDAAVAALHRRLDDLTEQMRAAGSSHDTELAEAHAEHERLELELAEMRQSTCWRLTRPIRAAIDAVRRR